MVTNMKTPLHYLDYIWFKIIKKSLLDFF